MEHTTYSELKTKRLTLTLERVAELEQQLATADARAVSLNADNGRLNDLLGEAQARLQRIADWCDAYPLDMFPPPDYSQVRLLFGEELLSRLSAHNYRHVVNGMRAIAAESEGA